MKKQKKVYKSKKSNEWMLLFPLIVMIVLLGGIYPCSVFLTGIIISILLVIKLQKNGRSQCVQTELFWGSLLLCVSALLSIFAGIDKGQAWYGFLRVVVLAVWIYFLMQFEKEERDKTLSILPLLGTVMIIISVATLMIPGLKDFFWMAGRLGGTFQYSNTCALFFLLGIMIIVNDASADKKKLAVFDLLLVGVFLTGSKGAILILIPVFLWICVKKNAFRKNGIVAAVILIVGGLGYAVVSGDFQNVARIYTIFQYPSTLFGRLLYMKDALPILIKHPLGIGYMSYESLQPAIQTGVYTSKFVHNDWIQMGLDYGWLFLVAVVGVTGYQLKKGQQESYKKYMILMICGYSLMEFHLQYFAIVMILVLLFDYDEAKVKVKKGAGMQENQIFSGAAAVVFGYFAIAAFFSTTGNSAMALSMLSYDSQSMEAILVQETNKENAVALAQELIELNPYNSQAYNTLAYASLMDEDYESAVRYKFEVLEIQRFNMNEYADFENMINSIQEAADEDKAVQELCAAGLADMEELLRTTEENVSPIAYRLRDKPVFTWN